MQTVKLIILWLAWGAACFLPASALVITAPENRVWEIFSIGYGAAVAETTNIGSRTETSTSDYDSASIHGAPNEEIPTEANRFLFGPNAEFKAAEEAPQVFYRGDQAGQAGFQSYAAQAGGIENSQAVLANGNLNDLMASHAISSEFPPSPFISVTTDIEEANRFAGHGGTVYTLELAPGRAIPNPYNLGESEYLVPHSISPSEITGTIPYQKP